jgi:hypothetical protein
MPFHSTVLGGIALGVVVAAPATRTALFGLRRDRRAAAAATVTGVLLIGWILVETTVIREFSVLQPLCALAGAMLALSGDRTLLGRLLGDPAATSASRTEVAGVQGDGEAHERDVDRR